VPTRWRHWSSAAEESYRVLSHRCEAIAVVGLSMGGTLACWLAERHPEIHALALINPLVEPPAESFRDLMRGVLASGIEVAPGVGSDIAKEGATELSYDG